ncbi:hypothetical protein DMO16_03900 [Fictibacillus sp. S7]|nr:hypothetical protein DMO16_03900 [Fictibacillus sp. S7]
MFSEKENKKSPSTVFVIILAIISIAVFLLSKISSLHGTMQYIGFALFTVLCLTMTIVNRHSKSKMAITIVFFLFLAYDFFK